MTIRLECDQCGQEAQILEELRTVNLSGADTTLYRSEYAIAQLHWDCIAPYIQRRDAEREEEPPF